MKIKLINRNECVFSGVADLEHLYTFHNFPVFMRSLNAPPEDDIKIDMSWWISRSTGSIQLNPLLPSQILYDIDHGGGTIGKVWSELHKEFAMFISKYVPKAILEIGGGHGILSKEYHRLCPDTHWSILEPSPRPSEGVSASYIKGYLEDLVPMQFLTPIESVVHSYVIEHAYQPDKMIAKIASLIPYGKMMFVCAPNMKAGLEKKYSNMLNFEHTFYIDTFYLTILLKKNGFTIEDLEYHFDNYSVFVAAKKTNICEKATFSEELYCANKSLFREFINYYEKMISSLNEKIPRYSNVYLFGASVFSQLLLGFGLDPSHINCILDNDPTKQSKRLYGTPFLVKSPKILKDVFAPVVILKAGIYNQEIKEDIINNVNPSVIFWE